MKADLKEKVVKAIKQSLQLFSASSNLFMIWLWHRPEQNLNSNRAQPYPQPGLVQNPQNHRGRAGSVSTIWEKRGVKASSYLQVSFIKGHAFDLWYNLQTRLPGKPGKVSGNFREFFGNFERFREFASIFRARFLPVVVIYLDFLPSIFRNKTETEPTLWFVEDKILRKLSTRFLYEPQID